MDDILKQKLNDYINANNTNKSKWYALKNWVNIKNKPFSAVDALVCVYNNANGNHQKMNDIILHLTNYAKLQGRANTAYGDIQNQTIDIRNDGNGKLTLYGYDTNAPLNLKGQHGVGADDKRLKKDGTTKKPVQKTEEIYNRVGAIVRKIYPDETKAFIANVIKAIVTYANQPSVKASAVKIAMECLKRKLVYDVDRNRIVRNESVEKHTIIISEDVANELRNELKMTQYKFNNNIKQFLHDILVDPVNAQVPPIFKYYDYDRNKLLYYLKNADLIRKEETINDRDENGEPKTATMKVKYLVPKKNFERKLRNLYIKLFEKNVPEINNVEEITEDGFGSTNGTTNATSSGQVVQPFLSEPIRRKTNYIS